MCGYNRISWLVDKEKQVFFLFGRCGCWIVEMIQNYCYDLYVILLLCMYSIFRLLNIQRKSEWGNIGIFANQAIGQYRW